MSTHAAKRRKLKAAKAERSTLTLSAAIALRAADGTKRPAFEIQAYNGGAMRPDYVFSPTPVVIDLATLKASEPIPILLDHRADQIVGASTKVAITKGASGGVTIFGTVTGDIEDKNDPAHKVVAHARNGFTWRASVGVDRERYERVEAGNTVVVNGREFTGPLYILRGGEILEVSLTSVAADRSTTTRIAARSKKSEVTMDFHDWLKSRGFDPGGIDDDERYRLLARYEQEQHAGLSDEQRQLATIRAASDRWERLKPDERNDPRVSAAFTACLKGHGTAGDLDRACLEAYRARSEHVVDGTIRGGNGGYGANGRETLAAAILCHVAAENIATKSFGERTVQAARDLRIRHAMDLVEASCRMNPAMTGLPTDRAEMIRASFGPSTYSLPSALGLAGEKLMAETYQQTPATWRTWAGKKAVTSFREHTAIRPYLSGGFEELAPGGEIEHTKGEEEKYTFKADTYARMFSIDRRDLVNDDLGVFDEIFREIGRMAVRKIGDKLYGLLLSNPSNFFATGNNNYAEGTSTALDIGSLGAAVSLLRKQVDAAGNPIALAPAVLLVPPELEAAGASILNSTTMSRDSTADMLPEGNPWQGRMSLEVEPRLSTTGFHASISTKAWYVMAAPSTPLAVVAFLNGVEMPTTETLDAPTNQLGRSMRGYLDFGVALSDKRAGVKMKGEN